MSPVSASEVDQPPAYLTFQDSRITDSSGLAHSTYARRVLWTHNDRGDAARIFAVDADGKTRATLTLGGTKAVDVEDIAAGPSNTLWVGDLGDESSSRRTVQVYKVKEPQTLANATVTARRYDFRFEDGPKNAEALLVQPVTGRVYVVSKSEAGAGIYRAPLTLSTTSVNVLKRVADAPARVTAGAFTTDGSAMVLCNYGRIFFYAGLQQLPTTVTKPTLKLGESLEVSRDNTEIFVGSEGATSPVYALPMPDLTGAAPTPTPRPNPTPDTSGGLGVYNGGFRENPDEKTLRQFGAYPDVSTSYYQSGQSVNVRLEAARMKRGTMPNITMTTKGTQYLAGIANGDRTALAWLDKYVAGLKAIAAVDPAMPVYATLDHEYLGKVRRHEITGASANPAVYGRALSVLYRKAEAAAPNIETSYWMVGYDRAFEGAVGQAFTTLPTTIMFDPYANSANDTIASIATADMAWIKAQSWYVGQPIALAEFGMPVRFGDAAMARFFTDVRPQLDALGIEWATFFNRSRDLNTEITTGRYPKTVAAFASSLT